MHVIYYVANTYNCWLSTYLWFSYVHILLSARTFYWQRLITINEMICQQNDKENEWLSRMLMDKKDYDDNSYDKNDDDKKAGKKYDKNDDSENRAICYAPVDPHCKTFDQYHYDFQGNCEKLM